MITPPRVDDSPLLANSGTPRATPAVAVIGGEEWFNTVFTPPWLERLGEIARPAVVVRHPSDSWESRRSAMTDVEYLFTTWGAPQLDGARLQRLPRLKRVFHAGGSVRHLVSDEFWRAGLAISSANPANAQVVAEYTVGTILLALKDFWRKSADYRRAPEREYLAQNRSRVTGNYRSVVGLLSYGEIGQRVHRHLRHFSHQVLVCDRHAQDNPSLSTAATFVDQETLFARCNLVSIHTPLLEETRALVRGRNILSMPPRAVLINTSRGAVLAEAEVAQALAQRPDVFAILDVTEAEPVPADSPLLRLPNVVLTPHLAGALGPECERLADYVLEDFRSALAGGPVRGEISQLRSATMT
jgi:phosphoglycerate dehydrogenase-like enzyme